MLYMMSPRERWKYLEDCGAREALDAFEKFQKGLTQQYLSAFTVFDTKRGEKENAMQIIICYR